MKTDKEIKTKAIILWNEGNSIPKISNILGVSCSSLSRWTKNLELTGVRKARQEKKIKAIELRKKGFSALEISDEIGVPKGTIGHWVDGIEIPLEHQKRLEEKKKLCSANGCLLGSIINKSRADERHKNSFDKGFERARNDLIFSIICALYWGEGGKTRRCFAFSNSDPSMIKVVTSWLTKEKFEYKVDIRHHLDGTTENEIKSFWFDYLVGVKAENVSKVRWKQLIKSRSERKMIMGCLQIVVNNALFHSLVMGGID